MSLKHRNQHVLAIFVMSILFVLLAGTVVSSSPALPDETPRQTVGEIALLQAAEQGLSSGRIGWVPFLTGLLGAVVGIFTSLFLARGVQRRLIERQITLSREEHLATLGRVAAALAHELRNPLTSMRIIVQSSSRHGEQVSLDAVDFSILEQEIDRMDGAIQTFLDHARPSRPEMRPCIVQSLVRQAVSLVEPRAKQIDVELREDLTAEPIEIEADPIQLKQVLLNLLINALDASPGGGTVTVGSRVNFLAGTPAASGKSAGDADMVEIEIADSGVGLPEDLGERIFEPFVSTKETGTGLGLAICQRIIEDHGGNIVARNDRDAGAVVTVRLPRVPRQPLPPHAPTAAVVIDD